MGKRVPHIFEDLATGRLLYRRAFPEPLRVFLEKPRRELKIPLGVNGRLSPAATRQWETADRQFETEVQVAKAARQLQAKADAGMFDVLSPELIRHLVGDWKAQGLELDAEVRWSARPREAKLRAHARLGVNVTVDLAEALQLRAMRDLEGIVAAWGDPAWQFAAAAGVRLDRTSPAFWEYVRTLHDAQIEAWEIILRRLQGENIPTSPVPPAPPSQVGFEKVAKAASVLTFQAVVEALLDSPRKVVIYRPAFAEEAVRQRPYDNLVAIVGPLSTRPDDVWISQSLRVPNQARSVSARSGMLPASSASTHEDPLGLEHALASKSHSIADTITGVFIDRLFLSRERAQAGSQSHSGRHHSVLILQRRPSISLYSLSTAARSDTPRNCTI